MRSTARFGSVLVGMSVALAPAGATAAAEVPYLMYIKGSEGPPATPIPVLWTVRDHESADITIDLAQYAPTLSRLGLARVLKYEARREKAYFVVRAPELTSFVRTVATSIVQGFLQTSQTAGAWAQKPDAEVKMAELHIMPRPPRLEVTTWLHVSYLAPRKSGRAKLQDLIKGDIIFVGQPATSDDTSARRP